MAVGIEHDRGRDRNAGNTERGRQMNHMHPIGRKHVVELELRLNYLFTVHPTELTFATLTLSFTILRVYVAKSSFNR